MVDLLVKTTCFVKEEKYIKQLLTLIYKFIYNFIYKLKQPMIEYNKEITKLS